MNSKVFILILNWNGKAHLEYNLPSVTQTEYAPLEIVVMDNASSDGSVAWVREHFPQVTVIETGENLGYAGGNNVGLRYALAKGADYVVLLNNDTEVDPRWITAAVQAAEANPSYGMIGFDTVGEYKQNEDPHRSRFHELQAEWRGVEVKPTDHITGCALFLRAEMLRDIGIIDDVYFAYAEEDDLLNRAQRAGYQQVRVNVPVWHYNGGSWGRRAVRASYLAYRNNTRFLLKNKNIREIKEQTLWLLRFVLSFRMDYPPDVPHFRRLRANAYPVNAALLALALLWNLVNLPATLWSRWQDERRVRAARKRLAARLLL